MFMKQEYISEGKTIEEAILSGCEELNIDRDDAEVEVLETPSKGFLGFGATNAKVKITYEAPSNFEEEAKNFLEGIFERMNIKQPSYSIKKEGNELKIELEGEDMGTAIGYRGETLDALQYLTSLTVNRNKSEEYVRVILDIENYREKRKQVLENLAKRMAGKVIKYRRNVTLEPMQAYERRIIHSSLQSNENITTYSVGSDPHRKIVIAYNAQGKKQRD